MIYGVHIEVLLAACYALLLVGVAVTLELVARYSHRRSENLNKTGFIYRRDIDAWECPTGQYLTRFGVDPERRVASYRAQAHICNSCPRKGECTDSDDGRRLEMRLNAWIESELRRFHRGISLALLLLAALLLAAEMAHFRDFPDWSVLVALLLPITIIGSKHWQTFRNERKSFKPAKSANREQPPQQSRLPRATHRFRLLFESDAARVFRVTFNNGDTLLLRRFVFIDPSVNGILDEWSAEIVEAISGAHPDFHKLFHPGSGIDFGESEIAEIIDASNGALIYQTKRAA